MAKMSRDHKIRICVSHLQGVQRRDEMVRLILDKQLLSKSLQIKLRLLRRGLN